MLAAWLVLWGLLAVEALHAWFEWLARTHPEQALGMIRWLGELEQRLQEQADAVDWDRDDDDEDQDQDEGGS